MYDRVRFPLLAGIILFLLISFPIFAYAGLNQISLNSPREVAQATVSPDKTPSIEQTVSSSTPSPGGTPVPEKTAMSTPSPEATVKEADMTPAAQINVPEVEIKTAVTDEMKNRWLNPGRINMLVAICLLSGFIVYFIFSAQRGKELFVRKIAGLSALDDAVGRATEMGKAVLYIPGIMDMDDIQTLAGLSILSYVAQKTAEYGTPILVPTSRSLVMSTAHEVVKESYMRAGRPDAFRPDDIRYLTDDQFGFVAGVDGIMVRDKPAANFYMGCFYAESLILAETGHSTGAIQMAGTAMPSQLPFFVAACDYTLMGEELYAASAYLSRDPQQLGSLKGQDVCKAIILLCILAGCVLETIGFTSFIHLFDTK